MVMAESEFNPGKVSAEMAKKYAESEWEKYRVIQDRLYQSDCLKKSAVFKNNPENG